MEINEKDIPKPKPTLETRFFPQNKFKNKIFWRIKNELKT
jgi:hypothetical protein